MIEDCEETCFLRELDICSICDVPYKGMKILARIINVIDGDTVKVAIRLGTFPYKLNIRVCGVDCPESTKRFASCDLEMQAGKKSKEYTSSLLKVDDIVYIRLDKNDKYGGRYVGDIYISGMYPCKNTDECLSSLLIKNGYAKPYDGKKKSQWQTAELTKICNM